MPKKKERTERKISLRLFTSRNQVYMGMLLQIREDAAWFFNGQKKFLTVPFILTCAAALECSLNDALIGSLTEPDEVPLVDGYLSMSLRGKLSNVVPIITHNKFQLDRAHKTFKTLSELISLRNQLVHNKSTYEDHKGTVVMEPDGNVYIRVADGVAERVGDTTFGLGERAGAFHDALEDLHEKFFDAYHRRGFKGNDLVLPCRKTPREPHIRMSLKDKHA